MQSHGTPTFILGSADLSCDKSDVSALSHDKALPSRTVDNGNVLVLCTTNYKDGCLLPSANLRATCPSQQPNNTLMHQVAVEAAVIWQTYVAV